MELVSILYSDEGWAVAADRQAGAVIYQIWNIRMVIDAQLHINGKLSGTETCMYRTIYVCIYIYHTHTHTHTVVQGLMIEKQRDGDGKGHILRKIFLVCSVSQVSYIVKHPYLWNKLHGKKNMMRSTIILCHSSLWYGASGKHIKSLTWFLALNVWSKVHANQYLKTCGWMFFCSAFKLYLKDDRLERSGGWKYKK